MKYSRILAVASFLLLAACSGGGGSSSSPAVPAPLQTSSPITSGSTATLTLSFSLDDLSKGRKPLFVSPNATSIQITVNSVNGNTTLPAGVPRTTTVALSTAPGGNCTVAGSTETCTIPIPAPPGVVSYTFSTFDASNNLLASITVSFTIVSGSSNTGLTTTLDGVVKTVPMTVPTLAAGTPQNNPCTIVPFTAKDASGATITGNAPFLFPFTVTDNDNSGHTYLTLNGVGSAGTLVVTVTANSDVVRVCYDGQAVSSFSLTVSGNGATGGGGGTVLQPITFSGTTPDDSAHGGTNADPNFNQPTLTFLGPGAATQPFGVSESGYSGTFTAVLDAATCGTGGSAVATIATSDNKNWTVTPKNAGLCKVTVSDTLGQSNVLWIRVQAAKPIVFTGTTIDANNADPSFNQPTLTFANQSAATQNYTVSEAGYAGSFASALDVPTCGTGGSAIATISTSDNFTWTVTPKNPGFCKVTVTDTIGQSKVLWIQVKNPQPIQFTGTTIDANNADPSFNQPTLTFGTPSAPTQNYTVSEASYPGTFTSVPDVPTCGTGGSAVATISTSDNLTWTVTPHNAGFCKVTVSDTNSQSKVMWIHVQNPQPIAVAGTTLDDAAHGGLNTDPNFNQPTIFFALIGGATQNFVVSESGYAGTFNAALDTPTCGTGGSAVASIATSDNLTWTVTALKAGICKVTITDSSAQSKVIWISVTTGSVTVNGRRRN
jgi:hypothetical protein